jgi:hypothetical protein
VWGEKGGRGNKGVEKKRVGLSLAVGKVERKEGCGDESGSHSHDSGVRMEVEGETGVWREKWCLGDGKSGT